jgi:hypothetical protein
MNSPINFYEFRPIWRRMNLKSIMAALGLIMSALAAEAVTPINALPYIIKSGDLRIDL